MDTANKTLLDAIKICARNLFYQALAPFKKLYDNNRDDPVRFRELTRIDGVLRPGAAGMEVHLVSHMHLAPKMRGVISGIRHTSPKPTSSNRIWFFTAALASTSQRSFSAWPA